jgi:hypothetical protein
MGTLREWLDEQWDLGAAVVSLALALLVSAALVVVYNVAAVATRAPVPALESWPAPPSGPTPDADDGTGAPRPASAAA